MKKIKSTRITPEAIDYLVREYHTNHQTLRRLSEEYGLDEEGLDSILAVREQFKPEVVLHVDRRTGEVGKRDRSVMSLNKLAEVYNELGGEEFEVFSGMLDENFSYLVNRVHKGQSPSGMEIMLGRNLAKFLLFRGLDSYKKEGLNLTWTDYFG